MQKYISEFIGTFGLVFFGTGAIVINDLTDGVISHIGIAVAFGVVVMAMIYAFGEISGAHFNPAVTVGFWALGNFSVKELFPYIIAQLLGGTLASITLLFLFPEHQTLGITLPFGTESQSFVLEILLTFFLMLVIINVSTGSKETGMMAGIAIGGVVLLEALVAGPITGASMNPVRSFAPAIISEHLEHLWVYLTAPFIGAFLAVLVSKAVKSQEKKIQ